MADIHGRLQSYEEIGLKDTIARGIHDAAARGKSWDGTVSVNGRTYGFANTLDPDRAQAYSKTWVDRHDGEMKRWLGELNQILTEQPEWLDDLPDRMSTETVDESDVSGGNSIESRLAFLKKQGVKGLEISRGPDGTFSASRFTVEYERSFSDWNYDSFGLSITGGGTLENWSTSARMPRTNIIA